MMQSDQLFRYPIRFFDEIFGRFARPGQLATNKKLFAMVQSLAGYKYSLSKSGASCRVRI